MCFTELTRGTLYALLSLSGEPYVNKAHRFPRVGSVKHTGPPQHTDSHPLVKLRYRFVGGRGLGVQTTPAVFSQTFRLRFHCLVFFGGSMHRHAFFSLRFRPLICCCCLVVLSFVFRPALGPDLNVLRLVCHYHSLHKNT